MTELANKTWAGNTQLLETAESRYEVLQSGGGSEGKAAAELHQWVPGGMSHPRFGDLLLSFMLIALLGSKLADCKLRKCTNDTQRRAP